MKFLKLLGFLIGWATLSVIFGQTAYAVTATHAPTVQENQQGGDVSTLGRENGITIHRPQEDSQQMRAIERETVNAGTDASVGTIGPVTGPGNLQTEETFDSTVPVTNDLTDNDAPLVLEDEDITGTRFERDNRRFENRRDFSVQMENRLETLDQRLESMQARGNLLDEGSQDVDRLSRLKDDIEEDLNNLNRNDSAEYSQQRARIENQIEVLEASIEQDGR